MRFLMFLPEAYVLTAAAVFLVACAKPPRPTEDDVPLAPARSMLNQIALCLGLLLIAACCVAIGADGWFFADTYRVDFFSQVFKLLLAIAFFLVCVISSPLNGVEERYHPEYYLLLSTATLGMMMLVSARELLTFYISLELASYSLYVLVPMRKDEGVNIEAAIKYLLIGAASSAILLFGFSFIYGLAHTTSMDLIMRRMPTLIGQPTMMVGIILFACGLFFKLSVFPFHFWAPDVYQGAANQVTAFIATASKIAAAAILVRFFSMTPYPVFLPLDQKAFVNSLSLLSLGDWNGALGMLAVFAKVVPLNCAHYLHLQQPLILLAIITMTLGNLAAIMQTDMKRMLAYSSISQAGYILVGVLTLGRSGFTAVVFYAVAYLVMTFAAFMILVLVADASACPEPVEGQGRRAAKREGADERSAASAAPGCQDLPITGFAGLYKRSPLLALTLMVSLLSLGGVPPFVGFTGKWFIFSAAMEQHLWWLVLIGVINSTISVYYYLMVIKQAYLREPVTDQPVYSSIPMKLLCVATIVLITFGGVAPARLLEIARHAVWPLM